MVKILGISCFYHDSAAALIENENIIAAAQEERFTRKKHDESFPKNAINFVLNYSKSKLDEIDYIVFYEKPFLKFERLLETHIAFSPWGFKSFAASMPIWLREKLFQKDLILRELKKIDNNFKNISKIKFSEHHLSHAASAFYPSPFKESAILTLDGVGEWTTTSFGYGDSEKIQIDSELNFPHSLGLLYSAVTYYLGFKVNSGEYKVMGLAPYGEPKFKDLILGNLVDVKDDGSFKLNMNFFDFASGLKMTNKKFSNLFGRKEREPESEKLDQFHMDVAASIQAVTEEIVLKICRYIKNKYQMNNLCLSGGVALNCVANGKILDQKIFDNIWIQPASGDAGGALGAALAYYYLELKNIKKNTFDNMQGSLLGPKFDDNEIKKKLLELDAVFIQSDEQEMIKVVTDELIQEKAVGWFQGRMEYGPRALGSRSIIADPRSEKMQKNLNLKIKFRESFRPFAPSVLEENYKDYFNLKHESPYMLLVSKIKDEIKAELSSKEKNLFGIEKLNVKRSIIPAVTHVDYSARIQTVNQSRNGVYYKLIKNFYEKSGCPALVNTSFNIRGEPIVCSVKDAFNCFMGTDLDLLVINNFILFKSKQKVSLIKDYKNKYELD